MQLHTRRIVLLAALVAGFVGAMVGAAFLGIAMAKRDLPTSAGESSRTRYPIEIIVSVGQSGEPVYFAKEVQKLRDYWFANPSPDRRQKADSSEVRKLEGETVVRTLGQDADVVKVDVLTGDAEGETGWIHLGQLPAQP